VLDDRREVDLADVRRPVDGPRDRRRTLPGRPGRGPPTSPAGCRPGRSPRTRCTGRTARRTRGPARPPSAWSRAVADSSACLPRSGSACSSFSPRVDDGLGRGQLALTRPRPGKRNSGTRIGWPSLS
jgi:hypothetical protein